MTPASIPDAIRNLARWPMGRLDLSLRWSYLPAITALRAHFCRAGTTEKAQALGLRALPRPTFDAPRSLVNEAAAEELMRDLGRHFQRDVRRRGALGRGQATGFRLDGRRPAAIRADTSGLACHT